MNARTVSVWDPVVRIFHWSLVLFFAIAYVTGEEEGWLHDWSGYIVLGLVLFRLVWGFVGTRYARFASFLFSPRETLGYVRSMFSGHPRRYLGHNPAGALMVFALLVSLIGTSWTGILLDQSEGGAAYAERGVLLSVAQADDDDRYGHDDDDDDHERGEGDELWEELHEFFANFTLLLVFLHVGGVVVSSVLHGENLPRAMVTGRKRSDEV